MSWFIVDVEADGRYPGINSMVSFAAVKLDRDLKTTFRGEVRPISEKWDATALAVSNVTREQHLTFADPVLKMREFLDWLEEHNVGRHKKKMVFISDNPAFDFSYINYYFGLADLDNPFGYTARRVGDLYAGMKMDASQSGGWRTLRQSKHTHDPLQDAMGVAEALLAMNAQGLKIPGL